MTSISQQAQIPLQVTSVSTSSPSYSSAAKKAVSSPSAATGSSPHTPNVAVGHSGPVQLNHGKSGAILPANGKPSISPAVPAVSAPAIAYSSSVVSSIHDRQSSVTIRANGPKTMNGGSVSSASGKIQFGSITDSPAPSHSTPQVFQPAASASITIPNPRASEPSHSPSPIPQPSASGGRPPVVGPGNGVNFGSFGGDSDRYIHQASRPQLPLAPGTQQPCHNRRDSSQSVQSDLSNQQGRPAYPPNGRGRGSFQAQYQQHQMSGYPPPNNSFRNSPGQGRGGIPPFQGQGRPQFHSSPHQASRSPALANASIPGTPNMNPAMPMQNQQQYPGPYFPQHLAGPQFNYPHQYDPRGIPLQNPAYLYPQIQNMTYMPGPPQSPQPGYQQPHYTPGQYAPQAQQMSRNSSQMSEQRPASSMGQPQTPSIPPVSHPLTPQTKSIPKPAASFTRPVRKSAAIIIKRPDGEALDIESFKTPISPAMGTRARTPPVITSTITTSAATTPTLATHQSAIVENAAPKSSDQIKQEIIEKVKKVATEDSLPSPKKDEIQVTSQSNAGKDSVSKNSIDEVQENIKPLTDDESKALMDKAKQDEEDELERQIAEMEAAEAEREKKEAEHLQKREAEKKALAEANQKNGTDEEARKRSDLLLREQEREMERLEDEREKKRLESASKVTGANKPVSVVELLKSDSNMEAPHPLTESAPLIKDVNPIISVGSNISSTVAAESMGPPPKVNSTDKRGNKPTALNLTPLSGKPVEPPQPSAALKSLKSARFLTVLDPLIYPPSINSPNPALNQAVKDKGKSFKYDKEFLLQFQKVFIEKPSLEFESQIKALIGDADSGANRSGSFRASDGMQTRSGSNRNSTPSSHAAMGSFINTGKSLPPGTTSEQRYAISSSSISRPQMNAMSSFNRPRGAGFPAGNTMARNPSNSGMPHSPRQQSRRGNTSSKGYNPTNVKQEAQAAKTMPLTAGMDVKPIQISSSGWKPRSIGNPQTITGATGPTPGSSSHAGLMDPEMVQRKVKAALNKMTPEKFDKIADQILTIAAQSKYEVDGRTLRQVIQLTFEKATDEAHWASMYAKFCKRMLETMSSDIKDETILDKNGNVVFGGNLFRKYLLNRCQEEFERGWKVVLPEKPEGEQGQEKTEEAIMLSDEYYIAAAAKRRGLGLVQFIGELYKLSMLTERIMHECVKKLVDYTGIPDEAEIESLTKLLKTIGSNLDSTEKGKQVMDAYFQRIKAMVETPDLPSRLRFMLMDIMDLRKNRWASKESNKGPKTLEEVRAEAEEDAAQKAAESARGNQRGGGGGGGSRMQMGRGDSRNFSNNHNQPPPDYQKNLVGMDDLRRLTSKNTNLRASSQQLSFGPTSLFSSRSNSARKMGAGASFARAEESGASSRTGTPPQQKEKESATSINTFSPLAALGSGEAENPASPPSTSVSPALSKIATASVEKPDK
ncbi:BgTH12-02126 [Blumeria graminis f. sp. triticale]|uniref:BgTH12-02126 n=1 Tax=Blumeria graminis f. sp. triticale TaxID=1689686 RepID=A0A9W4CZQ2_BLUGR|nr:BgTH12-02126 [Blumeria graminis f. sp. triticale]